MNSLKQFALIILTASLMYSCSPAEGNFTGSEYMPDMAHSIAYEANVYTPYGLNTWDEESTFTLKDLSNPGEPVNGTVPRGYAGVYFSNDDDARESEMMHLLRGENATNQIAVPINGSVPYYYGDTEEERTRATAEIINNPFPISENGLARGKMLYETFCGICHGNKGDGLGYLANADENKNSKYLAVPANFLKEEFLNASNGRYYHAIMYGKNVMGGYSDKLSYEERWQVIHYIRSLQAKELKAVYTSEENTLNPDFGTPMAVLKYYEVQESSTTLEGSEGEVEGSHSSDNENHGEGH